MRNLQELADSLLFSFITSLSVAVSLKMVVTIGLRSRTTLSYNYFAINGYSTSFRSASVR